MYCQTRFKKIVIPGMTLNLGDMTLKLRASKVSKFQPFPSADFKKVGLIS